MNILMVCTGNTCRSPMAQALFESRAKEAGLCVILDSAGIFAGEGSPAAPNAQQVIGEYTGQVREHKAKQLTEELLAWADVVLVMEQAHKDQICLCYKPYCNRVFTLAEFAGEKGDIYDPYGQGMDVYRACAGQIDAYSKKIAEHFKKGEK